MSKIKKKCRKCYVPKPLDEFPIRTERLDGHDSICSECRVENLKKWVNKRNKERDFYAQFSPI